MAGIGLAELVIIGVVLLVLLAGLLGAAVVVVLLVTRGRARTVAPVGVPTASPYHPAPAPAPAPAPPAAPQPAAAPQGPIVRMLAASDYAFSSIDTSMRQCDLVLQARPSGAEPASAAWSDGKHQVTYRFDEKHGLRMIEIAGPSAKYLRNDILNMAYMPTLEGYQVSGLLASASPDDLVKGILAAEFIGINGDQKYYIEPIAKVLQHPDSSVRTQAQRVHALLTSR